MDTRHHDIHAWRSPEYAAEWVADAEARDPQRADQLALLTAMIPRPPDAAIRVLDLGAGYGAVTRAVLAAFPAAQVTLLDFSEAMFDQARARLGGHAAQLRYALGDFSAPGWEPREGAPFDAIVTASALHNLRDGARIAAVYREIAPLLAPGGALLNLDNVSAAGPTVEARYDTLRDRPRRASDGVDAVAHRATAGARYRRFGGTLSEHLEWLRAAGLVEVDCYSKWLQRALIGGYRP